MTEREKWDRRYRTEVNGTPEPCRILSDYRHLLPNQGKALDLAAGRGGNALFLAAAGLDTEAWDISSVALEQLDQLAHQQGVALTTVERDIIAAPPSAASFDVIVVSRFLHRPLCPAIAAALRPGGLLFYQTFTLEKTDPSLGPSNPDYLLQRNELLRLFPELTLIAYREESLIGDIASGFRNEASLVSYRT